MNTWSDIAATRAQRLATACAAGGEVPPRAASSRGAYAHFVSALGAPTELALDVIASEQRAAGGEPGACRRLISVRLLRSGAGNGSRYESLWGVAEDGVLTFENDLTRARAVAIVVMHGEGCTRQLLQLELEWEADTQPIGESWQSRLGGAGGAVAVLERLRISRGVRGAIALGDAVFLAAYGTSPLQYHSGYLSALSSTESSPAQPEPNCSCGHPTKLPTRRRAARQGVALEPPPG